MAYSVMDKTFIFIHMSPTFRPFSLSPSWVEWLWKALGGVAVEGAVFRGCPWGGWVKAN
jgi:hypothetical protein